MGARNDMDALAAGRGLHLPPHWQTQRPPSFWAAVFVCAADATLYASLLFGGLFLWLVAPGWPPQAQAMPGAAPALVAAAAVIAAAVSARGAVTTLVAGRSPAGLLALAGAAQLCALAAFFTLAAQVPTPTAHAHHATLFVIFIYAGIRAAIGAIFAFHGLWRWHDGYLSPRRSLDLRIARIWHDYATATGLVALAAAATMAVLA